MSLEIQTRNRSASSLYVSHFKRQIETPLLQKAKSSNDVKANLVKPSSPTAEYNTTINIHNQIQTMKKIEERKAARKTRNPFSMLRRLASGNNDMSALSRCA